MVVVYEMSDFASQHITTPVTLDWEGRGSPRTTSGLGEHPAFYDTAVRTCVGIQYIFFLLFLLFLISSSFSSSSSSYEWEPMVKHIHPRPPQRVGCVYKEKLQKAATGDGWAVPCRENKGMGC